MSAQRTVKVRFQFAVDVQVRSAWTDTTTMKQIEDQARREAGAALREALEIAPHVTVVGELGYVFTLAGATP